MILTEQIELSELIKNSKGNYPDRIKFCIDRVQKTVAIDEAYHTDMETELYNNGSKD